jgi:hypothetical protein
MNVVNDNNIMTLLLRNVKKPKEKGRITTKPRGVPRQERAIWLGAGSPRMLFSILVLGNDSAAFTQRIASLITSVLWPCGS